MSFFVAIHPHTFVEKNHFLGYSSAGRALEWHSRGQRFDPAYLHQKQTVKPRLCGLLFTRANEKSDTWIKGPRHTPKYALGGICGYSFRSTSRSVSSPYNGEMLRGNKKVVLTIPGEEITDAVMDCGMSTGHVQIRSQNLGMECRSNKIDFRARLLTNFTALCIIKTSSGRGEIPHRR